MITNKAQWVILHVTDFHLSNIGSGSREFLRVGYYDEYLRDLCKATTSLVPHHVDLIVATGDFVDRGDTGNFHHATRVLSTLARLVNLDESRIAVCMGNHDIVREKDTAGQHDAAREAFLHFSQQFSKDRSVHSSHRASLLKYDNGIQCLMLDGTRGSTAPDLPGTLDTNTTDQLVNDFVKRVPEDELLVIGSHYPISPFPDDFASKMEGPCYFSRHFWTEAIAFKKRVTALRTKAPTLWLFGDVHNSDAYSEGNHYHVITGRLGTRVPSAPHMDSLIPRQCRIITVTSDKDAICKIVTGNFDSPSHAPQPDFGTWRAGSSAIRRTMADIPDAVNEDAHELTPSKLTTTETETVLTSTQPVSVLDQNLSDLIYEKIRNDGLYRLGRFRTTGDRDSLGWVSVGQILGSGEYLARFCSASLSWLTKNFDVKPHINGGSVLFMGIDCWGASIAAILSAACGSEAICVAARADGRFHTVGELVDDDVTDILRRSKTVVVVSDVIATGRSIASLYNRIKDLCPDAIRGEQCWIALSVLIDAHQQSLPNCAFLAGIGVGCIDIKLPGMSSLVLPGEDIAPATVSFI